MKKLFAAVMAAALLMTACAPGGSGSEEPADLTVLTTTYPIYLFVNALTEEVEGVKVERLNTGETSCLHDYTLTVEDMKKIQRADVIAMNGAGLEEFMEDALASSQAAVIDCSENVQLLENLSHHHEEGEQEEHDHGHWDPHYWMDPERAAQMVNNLAQGLKAIDPDNGEEYDRKAMETELTLRGWKSQLNDQEGWPTIGGLVTFHDGFQYFADAIGIPLLASIEEEAGSEASAKEINEITALVWEKHLPVIFTEVNGSDATAKAIGRETGCAVAQLSMCMDGPDGSLSNYLDALMGNVITIVNEFAGEEIMKRGA